MKIDARIVTDADRVAEVSWIDGVLVGDDWTILRLEFEAAGNPKVLVGPGQIVEVDRELSTPQSFVALVLRTFTAVHITGAPDDLFTPDEIVNPND